MLLSSGQQASSDSSSSSDSQYLSKAKGYYETEKSTISLSEVDTSAVVKSDRTTWICKHPGWWLNKYAIRDLICAYFLALTRSNRSHPGYVDANHPECASDLAAFRADNKRFAKRASHHQIAKSLNKRGGQQFYIITQDHIYVSLSGGLGGGQRRWADVDFIMMQDMATRAISSGTLSTYGGYTSTTLSLWNKVRSPSLPLRRWAPTDPAPSSSHAQGDKSQLWTINSA